MDVDNVDENKTEELTRIDEVGKIVEQTTILTIHDDDVGVDGDKLVAEEVIVSLVDELLDISIANT